MKKRFLSIHLFCMTITLLPACGVEENSSELQNIFGEDNRIEISHDQTHPFQAMGKIIETNCAGTLIGSNLVLTAASCVIDIKARKPRKTLTFQANYLRMKQQDQARVLKVHQGTYRPDLSINKNWAILELEKHLGERLGFFPIKKTNLRTFPKHLNLISYDKDHDSSLWKQTCEKSGTVTFDKRLVFHNCDTTSHDIGTPIFEFDASKEIYRVVGINAGALKKIDHSIPYSKQYGNIAIWTASIVRKMNRLSSHKNHW